jgi:probable phosphoglycerate mutase
MIELFLIRHCEGYANKMNLISGDCYDSLSDKGLLQLKILKKFIHSNELIVDFVFSSNWKRAILTAKELFGSEIFISDDLGETNSGLDSNLTQSDFLNKNPTFYLSRFNKFDGGESHFEMKERVILFFNNIIKMKCNKKIAIISHAGPLSTIIQHILKLEFEEYFPKFIPSHGTITKILLRDDGDFESLVFFSYSPDYKSMSNMIKINNLWP